MAQNIPRMCEVVGLPGAGKTTFIENATSGPWEAWFHDLDDALFVVTFRAQVEASVNAAANENKQENRDEPRPLHRRYHPLLRAMFPDLAAALIKEQAKEPDGPVDLQQLRKRFVGERFHRASAKFESLADFTAQHGTYVQKVLDAIRSVGEQGERRLMLTWLFNLFAEYQRVNAALRQGRGDGDKIVLIDEGFIGRVVTLFAYRAVPPAPDEIRGYVRLAPKPDAVIRLTLSLEECHSRLSSRAKGPPARFRSLTAEQQLVVLKNCRDCIDTALDELSAAGVPVIAIDSGQKPQDQVSAAAAVFGLAPPAAAMARMPG